MFGVLHGKMATGKTVAMKAMLRQMKEAYLVEGKDISIVSNIRCCFADEFHSLSGLQTRLGHPLPENALVGVDNLDHSRNPTALIRGLLKNDNVVLATTQNVEELSEYLRINVEFYAKPRMNKELDVIALDVINIHRDSIGILPAQFVKQAKVLTGISRFFCDCWKRPLVGTKLPRHPTGRKN